MKKFSTTFLMEILREKSWLIALGLFFLMAVAAFSIAFCEKEIPAQEKKWRSLYELKEVWESGPPKSAPGLTRYEIKISLTRPSQMRAEVRFCDRYSFLFSERCGSSGVYYKAGQGEEKLVSKVKYADSAQCPDATSQRSKTIRLRLKCDLIEKTVLVSVNGKFMEKVPLGPEPLYYNFGLFIRQGTDVTLNEMEILGDGRVVYDVNFSRLFFYKSCAQIFLFLMVLIFFILGSYETFFLKKILFFIFPLAFIEIFLRVAYPEDPRLDIEKLKPEWQFEISTNFYGSFNDPEKFTIRPYLGSSSPTYMVANPEHALRIICVGSSPLVAHIDSPDAAFPGILEKKLNAWNNKKNEVISLAVPMASFFNSPELVLYVEEILKKIDPDLILFYGLLAFPHNEKVNEQLRKDYAFYQRAKSVAEKNSDWIKNDRLLYAALEFKKPVKEIVYLYSFLCKSYLFMAVENMRKRFLNEWQIGNRSAPVGKPDSLFEGLLSLCKKKGIKVVFIPRFEFLSMSNDKETERAVAILRRKHPETYYMSLEGALRREKDFLLARDEIHPSLFGHEVIAEAIFRQLTENELLNLPKDL